MSKADAANPLWPRRGPLYERFAACALDWCEINDYQVVARLDGGDQAELMLCDVSHVQRIGFKGQGTLAWLGTTGIPIPAAPNRWLRDATRTIVARLGQQDFLICDAIDAPRGAPASLAESWQAASAPRGFQVPRQHSLAAFAIYGASAAEVFARVCAVDLRPAQFAADAIAQTVVANTVATVLRHDRGTTLGYLVFVDTSLALYLWDVLVDVAATLAGRVIGYGQLPVA